MAPRALVQQSDTPTATQELMVRFLTVAHCMDFLQWDDKPRMLGLFLARQPHTTLEKCSKKKH